MQKELSYNRVAFPNWHLGVISGTDSGYETTLQSIPSGRCDLGGCAAQPSIQTHPRACLIAVSLGNTAQAKTRAFRIPTPASQPISITMGPDGNFWFTEQNSSRVARVTPQGVITEFQTPTFSFPFNITPGPDGNIWFSEGSTGQIASITPAGLITEIMFSTFDASSESRADPTVTSGSAT